MLKNELHNIHNKVLALFVGSLPFQVRLSYILYQAKIDHVSTWSENKIKTIVLFTCPFSEPPRHIHSLQSFLRCWSPLSENSLLSLFAPLFHVVSTSHNETVSFPWNTQQRRWRHRQRATTTPSHKRSQSISESITYTTKHPWPYQDTHCYCLLDLRNVVVVFSNAVAGNHF
jgi:hypothetical protein